jgi:hypothetical protein
MKTILLWLPRILAILFIIFISLFALDMFEMGLSGWDLMVGLFMHLIPSFVCIAALLIAWRWQLPGGILFMLAGACFVFLTRGVEWMAAPLFLVGILFLLYWILYQRKNATG